MEDFKFASSCLELLRYAACNAWGLLVLVYGENLFFICCLTSESSKFFVGALGSKARELIFFFRRVVLFSWGFLPLKACDDLTFVAIEGCFYLLD